MIKQILVGIADQPYTVAATRHAIDIAKCSNATLTGMSVLDYSTIRHSGPTPIGAGHAVKEWREQLFQESQEVIRESIDVFERICGESECDFEALRRSGNPLKEFIDVSRYYDFFVVGLHKLFEHGLLEDAPDNLVKLVTSGVYPMLAVTETYRPIERVLIAYSGSVESARTIRSFVQHSHVWPITDVQVVSFGSPSSDGPANLVEIQSYLQAHDVACEVEFVEGASRQLPKYAEDWRADLVVLGNSAKNLLRRKVFGETALKTIRESQIPLFLAQ